MADPPKKASEPPVTSKSAKKSDDGPSEEVQIEEDIPSDFFDVFSNNDFMAGLDIVDAWDESEAPSKNNKSNVGKKQPQRRPNHPPKQPIRNSRDELERRRDPEKTKRDIQKDKDKCAKDKEARIICEKLKVVETGLVPPGMEMEVDLKELHKSKVPEKQPTSKKEKEKPRRSKSNETFRKRRAISPIRRSPRRVSPLRRSSPRRISPLRRSPRRFSPIRRSPRSKDRHSPDRVYIRVKERNRPKTRSRSPYGRRRSYGRDFDSRGSRRSPLRKKRRDSFDLSPTMSERELWLRHKERNILSPSEFARKKRNVDFLEEISIKLKEERRKKAQLMKEIREEMNVLDSRPDPHLHTPPNPNVLFMPGSGPPPQFFQQPSIDPLAQYDEQYFIGQSAPIMPNYLQPPNPNYPNPNFIQNPPPMMPFQQPFYPPPNSGQILIPHVPPTKFVEVPCNNVNVLANNKPAEMEKDDKTINKLFEDKKISLTDYLSITAKTTDLSTPDGIKKKIRVITLCQEAIKTLGRDSNLGGRFFLKKSVNESNIEDKKDEFINPSPLRTKPVIRFVFTTPVKSGKVTSSLQSDLSKLLISLGLGKTAKTVPEPSANPSPSPLLLDPVNIPSKSHPVTLQSLMATTPPKKYSDYDLMSGKKHKMKMCQTDPVTCNECQERKARKFESKSTQCDIQLTNSGTQTTEEDVPRPAASTKNQSLAHLTPAQLLKESFSSGRGASQTQETQERNTHDFSSRSNSGNRPNQPTFEPPNRQKSFNKFETNPRFNQFDDNPRFNQFDDNPRFIPYDDYNDSRRDTFDDTRFDSSFNDDDDDDYDNERDFDQFGNNSNQRNYMPQRGGGRGGGGVLRSRPFKKRGKRGNFVAGPYGGRTFY